MLRTVSLYTGVGGLDFGLEAAGFTRMVGVEIDSTCCAFLRKNRPRWKILEGDIQGFDGAEILRRGSVEAGEVDLLVGGPPCQPFSKSGYWASGDAQRLEDPRAETLRHYLEILQEVRPRALLLENVPGLAFRGKSDGLDYLFEGIRKVNATAGTNYRPVWKVINAASYGVPQLRERVFIVASRDGQEFKFPSSTHAAGDTPGLLDSNLESYRTAWDALGDLRSDPGEPGLEPRGKWAELLPTIPEGENYLWHTVRGGGYPLFGWRRRYWSFLLKLSKDRPSWTIQAQPGPATGPFHWRSRRLSSQELCRLQTFPKGLEFECSHNQVQRMLGNAVPSLVTEVLGLAIRSQLLGTVRREKQLGLLPPCRGKAPEPEPVAPLPERYEAMIGEHSDHPGEGKGRRAQARALAEATPRLL